MRHALELASCNLILAASDVLALGLHWPPAGALGLDLQGVQSPKADLQQDAPHL
jgi:hypothetical protein